VTSHKTAHASDGSVEACDIVFNLQPTITFQSFYKCRSLVPHEVLFFCLCKLSLKFRWNCMPVPSFVNDPLWFCTSFHHSYVMGLVHGPSAFTCRQARPWGSTECLKTKRKTKTQPTRFPLVSIVVAVTDVAVGIRMFNNQKHAECIKECFNPRID